MNLIPLVHSRNSLDVLLAAGDLIKHSLNDLQTTEFVAVNKAGVEPDLIGQIKQHGTPGRVAEKYGVGEPVRIVNKLIANPEKIGISLLCQGFRGVNAGMDTEKWRHDEIRSQVLKKIDML